jgi:5-methylthioadenosine/S-adenosylhomocysteine deaminase
MIFSNAWRASVAGLKLFAVCPAATAAGPPPNAGKLRHRHLIRGGSVMTTDRAIGNFVQADVLVDGKKVLTVGPNLAARSAVVIDATGRIVMPRFIYAHHRQFETALRSSSLSDAVVAVTPTEE